MTIGERLMSVRLSLGLTRKEFAHDVVDSSFLAYVENNKSNIRIATLVAILQKNDVSVIDFLSNIGGVNSQPINSVYRSKASEAFFRHDINALKEIVADPKCTSQVIKQVVQLMIAKLQKEVSCFPNKTKHKLKRTFLQIEQWDVDSLWVLANSMEIYRPDELEGVVNSVFHSFVDFKEYNEDIIELLATIAVNYLKICFKNQSSDQELKKAIDYLNKLPCITSIVFQKIEGKFFEAIQNSDYVLAKEISQFLKVS